MHLAQMRRIELAFYGLLMKLDETRSSEGRLERGDILVTRRGQSLS